jgi:GntR family transcriptional regulator
MPIIDPGNPIPKYIQISSWIKELIETGRYRCGDKLPSEIEFSRMCGVNRNTVRQAIAFLATEGMLRREKGRGTFVSAAPPGALIHRMKRISSFSEDIQEHGLKEYTKVIKYGVEEPAESIAKELLLRPGSKVAVIRRVRCGGKTPFIYEESRLPYDLYGPILDLDLSGSMYRMLTDRFGVILARSQQVLRAVNLRGKIASILMVTPNTPGIFMESVTFDEKNMPVEVLYSYYRGDRYLFEVEVTKYRIMKEGEDYLI